MGKFQQLTRRGHEHLVDIEPEKTGRTSEVFLALNGSLPMFDVDEVVMEDYWLRKERKVD